MDEFGVYATVKTTFNDLFDLPNDVIMEKFIKSTPDWSINSDSDEDNITFDRIMVDIFNRYIAEESTEVKKFIDLFKIDVFESFGFSRELVYLGIDPARVVTKINKNADITTAFTFDEIKEMFDEKRELLNERMAEYGLQNYSHVLAFRINI